MDTVSKPIVQSTLSVDDTTRAADASAVSTKRALTRNERSRQRMLQSSLPLAVARFGLPLAIGMALHTMFNWVDMFMISRLDNAGASLGALGICDMVAAVATIISNGVSTATVARISHSVGSQNLKGIRVTTWQSLWLVSLLSLVFGALGLFGSDFVVRVLMQAKGETADLAVPYLRIVLGGCFSIFLLLQVTAILRALGHAKSAAGLLVFGNALNIVLNPVLIYGQGPSPDVFAWALPLAKLLGAGRLGVVGAAWATLIGRSVPVFIGLWLLMRRRGGPRFHAIYLKPRIDELRSIFNIAWPSSTQLVVRVLLILVFVSLVNANFTSAGDLRALTAYSICLRLETMALFVGMGWGAAASSFVAANLGAGNTVRAKAAGWYAAFYNVLMMAILVVLYLSYTTQIVGFFDKDPEVIAIGREYLKLIGLGYLALGVAVVLSQAMAGASATLSSLIIDCIVVIGVVIPAAYVVTEVIHGPRVALWSVMLLNYILAAIIYIVWYIRGRFMQTGSLAKTVVA